jgi:AraC-like DNA-binding protein
MIWNIVLLLSGALQAVLLASLLFTKKAYRQAYGFLIAYLVVLTAQLLFKVADKLWLMNNLTFGYSISYHFPLLYGPLMFLFAKYLMQAKRFSWQHTLHFFPFLYASCVEFLVNDTSPALWLYWPLNRWPGLAIQIASVCIYHVKALNIWSRYNGELKVHFPDVHSIRMLWVRKLFKTSFGIGLAVSLLLFFIYNTYPDFFFLRWGFLLLPLFIYWISYSAMRQPEIFVPIVNKSYDATLPAPLIPALTVHKPARKYASSNLSPSEGVRIRIDIIRLMEEEVLFTDPELTIEKLSIRCRSNRHLVSQVLNQHLNQSFYDFVNGYRINEAKRMLADPANGHLKIASIAYDVGFNSLSAFNDVFRKTTGLTPSAFRRLGGGQEDALTRSASS